MDLDLDFTTDQISQYLNNKLKEFEQLNSELEQSCQTRKKYLEELCNDSERLHKDVIEIKEVWKRIVRDKYVIGILLSTDCKESFGEVNVLLTWDNLTTFNYEVHIISSKSSSGTISNLVNEGLNWTNKFNSSAQILIVMNVPPFIEQLSHNVTGLINISQKDVMIKVKLPVIQLINQDQTDNSIMIQNYKIVEGKKKDLFSIAATNKKYEFTLILPEDWDKDLDTTFGTYCAFRKIDLISKMDFYLVHNLCHIFDGTLIEIDRNIVDNKTTIHLNIYCINNDGLVALVHYVHRQIINGYLVPRNFWRNWRESNGNIEDLANCLVKELDCIQKLLHCVKTKYSDKAKTDLLDAEFQSDLHYLKWDRNIND